ncbi:MAG: integration host factor subunit beta [Planctomycetota bacterium]|nr:MAG: integration host factor subunit beta [Planctomycetota bacterium]
MTKTKRDIVREVSERLDLNQKVAKEAVQLTLDSIIEALRTDGRIELRNFGVFEVKRRRPRTARNPKTGEPVPVGEKNVITFKPGKLMADVIQASGVVPDSEPPSVAREESPPSPSVAPPPAAPRLEEPPHWSQQESRSDRTVQGRFEGSTGQND